MEDGEGRGMRSAVTQSRKAAEAQRCLHTGESSGRARPGRRTSQRLVPFMRQLLVFGRAFDTTRGLARSDFDSLIAARGLKIKQNQEINSRQHGWDK